MDVLGILRFWRNTNTGAGADVSTSVADMRNSAFGTNEEESDDDSFIDLIITSPNCVAAKRRDGDLKNDSRFSESPKDFFKRKVDCSSARPQSPVSILRPIPKFMVFMLGFKKLTKLEKNDPGADCAVEPKLSPVNQLLNTPKRERSKPFAVKNRSAAPGPFFARENRSPTKMLQSCEYGASPDVLVRGEKSVPKYMKLIKPFYVKASRKSRSSDSHTPSSSPMTEPATLFSKKLCEASRVGSLKVMTRSLGKSRSASSMDCPAPLPIRRRDDSLLEQYDGIQGAILYCKNSFNSPSYREISRFSWAASNNSHEKMTRNTLEEQKRCSI